MLALYLFNDSNDVVYYLGMEKNMNKFPSALESKIFEQITNIYTKGEVVLDSIRDSSDDVKIEIFEKSKDLLDGISDIVPSISESFMHMLKDGENTCEEMVEKIAQLVSYIKKSYSDLLAMKKNYA